MAIPRKFLQVATVGFSAVGLVVPAGVTFAEAPSAVVSQQVASAALDVALGHGGVFRGQVVTPTGTPSANEPVELHFQGKVVAKTVTDNEGKFAFQGVRSGQHTVIAGEHGGICRLWTAETAPPAALTAALLVKGDATARGQWASNRRGALLMAGVVTGIVVGGVISQETAD